MLEVGESAPTFALPDQHGETVALEDFAGGHLVVYFYPRADTPGCTNEATGFRDQYEQFQSLDADVVGISDDPVADLQSFAEEYDLPFALLSDEDGEVASSYDAYGEKQMFGNTFDGVFRHTYVVGPDGDVVAVYEDVDPEGHAERVLDNLRE